MFALVWFWLGFPCASAWASWLSSPRL